jgi:hypothetical protein
VSFLGQQEEGQMVILFDLSSTLLFHGRELIGWDLIRKDMRKVITI